MFRKKETGTKLKRFTLANGWSLFAHEESALFQKDANEYALMDWDEDVILKWTVKEDELDVTKSSWDLKYTIRISTKTITVYNEPEFDED